MTSVTDPALADVVNDCDAPPVRQPTDSTHPARAANGPSSADTTAREPGLSVSDMAVQASLIRIADLDVAQGLLSVRNRPQTYHRLLSKYIDLHAHDMALVREHLVARNFDEARRLAHSLKGVSATLGANEVRARALELETAIVKRLDSGSLEAYIVAVERAWDTLAAMLRQALLS